MPKFFDEAAPLRELKPEEIDAYLQLAYEHSVPDAHKPHLAFHSCVRLSDGGDTLKSIKKIINNEAVPCAVVTGSDISYTDKKFGDQVKFVYVPILFKGSNTPYAPISDYEDHYSALIVEVNDDKSIKKIHQVDAESRLHRAVVTRRFLQQRFPGVPFAFHNQGDDNNLVSAHYVLNNIFKHIQGAIRNTPAISESLTIPPRELRQIQQEVEEAIIKKEKFFQKETPAAVAPADTSPASQDAATLPPVVQSAAATTQATTPVARQKRKAQAATAATVGTANSTDDHTPHQDKISHSKTRPSR